MATTTGLWVFGSHNSLHRQSQSRATIMRPHDGRTAGRDVARLVSRPVL